MARPFSTRIRLIVAAELAGARGCLGGGRRSVGELGSDCAARINAESRSRRASARGAKFRSAPASPRTPRYYEGGAPALGTISTENDAAHFRSTEGFGSQGLRGRRRGKAREWPPETSRTRGGQSGAAERSVTSTRAIAGERRAQCIPSTPPSGRPDGGGRWERTQAAGKGWVATEVERAPGCAHRIVKTMNEATQ